VTSIPRVLVTGAGAVLGQGILRALLSSERPYYLVAADPSPLSAGLYWTDSSALLPMAADPSYLDQLRALLGRERPDVLIPGTDVELPFYAKHRAALETELGVHILVSDERVVSIANDKYLTFQFLHDNDFPRPESVLRDDALALAGQIGFPLVVKPRVGARSVGVHVVHDEVQLLAALDNVRDPVVQECVGDDDSEYTAGVLCFDGRCDASVVMRRDLRDGNTYRAFVEQSPELNRFVQKVGRALRPYGPSNFQFRISGDVPKIFEINGRFSGTTPLRHLCGFPEVEMCIDHILSGVRLEQPIIQEMTILRHWGETIVRSGGLLAATDPTDA
jgi:carbamoyl-phosphate synthase large subunit